MIKLGNEGYYFISDSDIKYDLYEGVTMGGDKRYTSDTIFIMLTDERYIDKVESHFVNYWMGAFFLEEDINDYDIDIGALVTEYEKKNGIYRGL